MNPFQGWSQAQVDEHNERVRMKRIVCPPHYVGDIDPISERSKIKRIRQTDKPLLNKLESEWFAILNAQYPNYPRPRAQAKRYRLANGAWYKPDITASLWPQELGPAIETAWECKGPKEMKNVARGMLTIKFAATAWPEVRFVLVWKEAGQWHQQTVLS